MTIIQNFARIATFLQQQVADSILMSILADEIIVKLILKIYRGKTKVNNIGEIEGTGEYDEAHPLFDGLVEIKKGSFSTPN